MSIMLGRAVVRITLVSSPSGFAITTGLRSGLCAGRRMASNAFRL